ncbi:LOW QUALITY PROTEIN: MORC family CW-type zinc finger protein 1 [Sciurus carolinensis]|uniref:LOW QUALITY PROTEIN: MORC family CW-type zinc finger protein 1 n=1 Tax=Sciurus carolinensis TaxID=30640 RepID=UPI001FB39631|nr:LOW QUALITY PROTEIN: MORC family CW-type zinc finger protein 1 [Sciurus carolinensis]
MNHKYAALQRAQLHLDFIHANSTTHSFLFGALAELLDNARDAGAARLDVFSVDNEKLQGGFMLCFLDDGCGMSPEEASDIIYFGTSKKRLSTLKFIGQYGNGLKSGSMRIGKDFILFTKKEETMTCVFFSQSFCEREGLSEVVVPMPSWLTRTRESVTDDPQKFSTELSIIYKYSPFKNEAELMQQFDLIYGKCGTLLVIYNLKLLLSGEPELDIKTDKEDILMAGALEDFPERWSFRAYTSVLYFDPWMRIFIQAKRVQTKHLCYCLYRPRKYLYVTYSFKGTLKNEVKKAEEAVKIAELSLKEAQIKVNQPDRTSSSSAKDVLQKALEDVEAKHKNLKEKQRELKKARTLFLFFGVNIENRSRSGMFIYSNNRLIKMHEKVGPQLKLKSLLGAGVVGIVNIPLEIMEPSHNKQEFLNVQEYNHLLKVMGQYLVQYCKDTGISNRNLTSYWNEFGYQHSKDMETSSDSLQYQRRQAMAIPFMVQCDLCLKWRVLPSSTNYQEKEFHDMWICANNPNLLENSCQQVESLPSIPLGTISTVLPSKNEKERQLTESVQRYQNKLAEQQPKPQFIPMSRIAEFTRTCPTSTLKVSTESRRKSFFLVDLKHESLSPSELSVSHRSQKRNTESTDSDIEYVSEYKITKKSMQKKMKSQQQRHAVPENIQLAERSQKSQIVNISTVWGTQPSGGTPRNTWASSWEMKRRQSLNLRQECKVLSENENSNGVPDIILVLDKSSTEVSLKQEQKEVPLKNEEKQELCSDTPAIEKDSSFPNWESSSSVSMEDLNPRSGQEVRVSASGDCKAASSLMISQSTTVKETARKLMSNLREILLYFFPEYQLPSEFDCISVEELRASSELEQGPEQTNKKLKICFNQIQNVYMVQYEKKIKRKMQSIIYDANRRGILNEIALGLCEQKRRITEDKLKNLRVKLAVLLQKLQLDGPADDLEQIDIYLEALLKEDNLLSRPLEQSDAGHGLPLESNGMTSQN